MQAQRGTVRYRAKQAREARWSGQSAKRQKMMDELNKREATAARERSSEDLARSRLQVLAGLGFKVWGLRLRVWGAESRVWGLGLLALP